jgi:hypothetical protein
MGVPDHPLEPDLDVVPLPLNDEREPSVGAFMSFKQQGCLLQHQQVVQDRGKLVASPAKFKTRRQVAVNTVHRQVVLYRIPAAVVEC